MSVFESLPPLTVYHRNFFEKVDRHRHSRNLDKLARKALCFLGETLALTGTKLNQERLTARIAVHAIPYEDLTVTQLALLPKIFRSIGLTPSESAATFVRFCVAHQHTKLARAFVKHKLIGEETFDEILIRSSISDKSRKSLIDAFEGGDFDKVGELLHLEKSLSHLMRYQGIQWIRIALNADRADIASFLVDYQMISTRQFRLLAHFACMNYHTQFAQKLTCIAIKRFDLTSLELISKYGLNFSLPLISGSTLLHYAAHLGNREAVDYLLQRGVDPNQRDFLGRTALMVGLAEAGNHRALGRLCETTDLNAIDDLGRAALHYALSNPQFARPYIEALIENTDLTIVDSDGHRFLDYLTLIDWKDQQYKEHIERLFQSKGAVFHQKIEPTHPLDSWEQVFGHINSLNSSGSHSYKGMTPVGMFLQLKQLSPFKKLPSAIRVAIERGFELHSNPNPELTALWIKNGSFTLIPVLSSSHAYYIVTCGGYIAISNRIRWEAHKSLEFYQIHSVSIEAVSRVLHKIHHSKNESTGVLDQLCYKELISVLDAFETQQTKFLATASPSRQKRWNCSYVNLIGAIRAMFILHEIQQGALFVDAICKGKDQSKRFNLKMRLASIRKALHIGSPSYRAVLEACHNVKKRPMAERLAPNYGEEVARLLRDP